MTRVFLVLLVVLTGCPSTSAPDAFLGANSGRDEQLDGGSTDGGTSCEGELPPWAERVDGSVVARCGSTTLTLTTPLEGILRLRYASPTTPSRSYAVTTSSVQPLRAAGNATSLGVCIDGLRAELRAADCHLRVMDASGAVLQEDAPGGGYFERPDGSRGVDRLSPPEERLYGLGEKSGGLDKRGRTWVMWGTDPYVDAWGGYPPGTDPLYQSIPFFLAHHRGVTHGVLTDNSYRTTFDLGATQPERVRVTAAGGVIDQYVIAGPTPAEVLRRYTALTGRAPLPPRWTLGFHQSRWGYSPDTEVRSVADELRRRRFPADAMWLDIQHQDGFRTFTWDPVTFGDPRGLTGALAAQGLKTVVIVNPAIKADAAWDVFASARAGGHLLLGRDGMPWLGTVWPGTSVFPDFTAPAARGWWSMLVQRPLSNGVRGLWIDMNEPTSFTPESGNSVPNDVTINGDGLLSTMAEGHNVYALAEARATYEGMRAAAPQRRPFILTRAGYAGIQRYAAVWTGDAPSRWETLRETVPMLLGLGLSGVPFVGSDVGGYGGAATPELYARWMALGSISPFFRVHTMQSGARQEPWRFGQEVEDLSRALIMERYRLVPYFYSLMEQASRTGAPVLRPLVYEFPQDTSSASIDDEVMVGPWLLYAPVLDRGATERRFSLPPGRWFECTSGAVFEGPGAFTTNLTLAALPCFVREGAIIPRGPAMRFTDEGPLSPLSLDVYPSSEPSTFSLYEDDGDSFAFETGAFARTTYSLQRTSTGATLTGRREGSLTVPTRALVVRIHRVDRPPTSVKVDGAELSAVADEAGLSATPQGWWWDSRDLSLVVRFADVASFRLEATYDVALAGAAPPVLVRFEVAVPAGTPTTSTVFITSNANGWTHRPLAWVRPGELAAGELSVPRGTWFFFKFTRGGFETVEKWPNCQEASNRYAFGGATPVRREQVFGWRDQCP